MEDNITIEEIDKEFEQLHSRMHELQKKRQQLQFESRDYTGKFIKCTDYGYMYVTWQTLMDEDTVLLHGVSFNSDLSEEYSDNAYFTFDASDSWRIPFRTFMDGEITEITEDEFISEYKKVSSNITEFGTNWIKRIVKDAN